MLITDLFLFGSPIELILILIATLCLFRWSYRAYSYSEVPVGITDQNDTHLFTLIHHSGYYHITMGIPRSVIINE